MIWKNPPTLGLCISLAVQLFENQIRGLVGPFFSCHFFGEEGDLVKKGGGGGLVSN